MPGRFLFVIFVSFKTMEPKFYRCPIGYMPMREHAAHSSQMVSMVLKEEIFTILESTTAHWHYIRTCFDNYTGWVFSRQLAPLVEETDCLPSGIPPENAIDQIMSGLASERPAIALNYLDVPYLWGGRSIAGIDCSGLSQVIMLHTGFRAFPRDARMQALHGEPIPSLNEAIAGDLAFFAEKEKVSHVGILTGRGTIIHAAETVREDKIEEAGIFNTDLNDFTLKVCAIRRFS